MPNPDSEFSTITSLTNNEHVKQQLYRLRLITADGCWLWQGNLTSKGYGKITVAGRNQRVHRVSYEVHIGIIGGMVLHTCDQPSCFNPAHLFVGDAKANQQDRVNKGRISHFTAKLTTEDVALIRRMFENGLTRHQISEEMNVHYTTIRDIINGRYWR